MHQRGGNGLNLQCEGLGLVTCWEGAGNYIESQRIKYRTPPHSSQLCEPMNFSLEVTFIDTIQESQQQQEWTRLVCHLLRFTREKNNLRKC